MEDRLIGKREKEYMGTAGRGKGKFVGSLV